MLLLLVVGACRMQKLSSSLADQRAGARREISWRIRIRHHNRWLPYHPRPNPPELFADHTLPHGVDPTLAELKVKLPPPSPPCGLTSSIFAQPSRTQPVPRSHSAVRPADLCRSAVRVPLLRWQSDASLQQRRFKVSCWVANTGPMAITRRGRRCWDAGAAGERPRAI